MESWQQWIPEFVHAYRGEANQLSAKEKRFLGEYIEERCLAPACHVQVLKLDCPYRLVLLFVLNTEPDLAITFRKTNWRNLNTLAEQLARKYELSLEDLLRMLRNFRDLRTEQLNFAVDGFKHVLAVAFPHDIRSWIPPLLKDLEHPSAKDIAELVFNLNYCQAADRY